ncbi:hypothetical protein G9C85_07370 [Halorubellus sp. JP-L1]|uniref:hypothetical protein n=1 Tax=Halorubellus sp. JP-L1 TaxID=2715753 RepID=UPI00140AFEA6|nr:hypothetical protein [Halorubellus sp. JP-L1]NHN41457.1 hypothetical protein [Halorubellus sp. JP-L1]
MMDTAAAQTDAEMQEGVGIDAVLVVGAVLGALGWALTQFLASTPGFALSTVGVDGAVVVVGYWALASVAMVALGVLAGQRDVRYSPLLWAWGVLVAGALSLDAVALAGLVGPELGRTLLWAPWPVVLAIGFALTGVVAAHRARAAYLVAAFAAGLVVLAAVLFPSTVPDWAFAATGVVHAVPLLVDARTGDRATGTSPDASGSSYEFRDLGNAPTDDDREEDHA